ncbi:MAG: hypothetical protein COU08_04630 [Candidatus Harrisonbacteria bacterium CG10_big_fil_rev_8_21_14_0_10_42_17]|uniref:Peptidase S8/S53 domain-containing protein n=1 Tax=Candidatus Harrisonbacteria bacterium CG10_big_fil_rev_8_21_14_0_10_42_17 TaxID=1974584 RepID=A0A2M6WH39_9BACT|nr:MAG: hypothetical protein COU08_04630 [Candidatus Harrisonbacteria bacterium CG10_big_fil_rev_8_21_14_0_10_42_17]
MKNVFLVPLLSAFVIILGFSQVSHAQVFVRDFSIHRSDELLDRAESRIRATFERAEALQERAYNVTHVLVRFKDQKRAQKVLLRTGESVGTALDTYWGRSDVLYAEPDYVATQSSLPNDPSYSYQWNLMNASGGIFAESAWDIANGSGVIVAVLDTGIAYENYSSFRLAPDLAETSFIDGYDYANDDSHPNDDEGHGTHVAGTIAQTTNNGTGVAGVAYGATLMPVKVLNRRGSGYYSDIANGIIFATDNGAKVINMSLGGSFDSSTLRDAVEYAYTRGVTIVAAAGNSGSNRIQYPAGYNDYVIAVGATRYDEHLAGYSTYGSFVDLVAPGGDSNIDQNGDGYGDGILQQTFGRSVDDFGYFFFQGTSMASPHVAGVAALLIQMGLTNPDDIRFAMESTAKDLGSSGRDTTYGWGLVNARAAIDSIGGTPPPPPPPLPPPGNEPPVASAGDDVTVLDNDNNGFESVTLSGLASQDPDGIISSYAWKDGSTLIGSDAQLTHSFGIGSTLITLEITDNDGATDSDTVVVTVNAPETSPPPPPTPSGQPLYFSPESSGSVGGISVANEDIVYFDGTSYSLYFDGSSYGLSGGALNAFHIMSDGSILMSLNSSESLPDIGSVDDSDIVHFQNGVFSLYFDGSDVDLTRGSEDIDAITLLPNGNILLSTVGSFRVSGLSGRDEDVFEFIPSFLGSTTSGSFRMYFNGSDVGISSSREDINGISIDSSGKLYLSTISNFSVSTVSGEGSDVFVFVPTTLGESTSGSFSAVLYFDGALHGARSVGISALSL